MRVDRTRRWGRASALCTALGLLLALPSPAAAQDRDNPEGQWRYQSADAWGTRYSPLTQIDASNFTDLEVAWIWRGDNFGPTPSVVSRSTPSYIDGMLYTLSGRRRAVVAIDPATGETRWTYSEPSTTRWERSMRADYGKGVAHAYLDGRLTLYVITPGFFLHAIDAESGAHLEGFGKPVPLKGFPGTGVVDLLPSLLSDWGPWLKSESDYDPDYGIPRELGYITSSSPAIVVDDVVVVGNSAEQGYNQTRAENVPGDIMGFDARSGEFLWKFHVIPRPGEFGHDTWLNDAWEWTGDISSWAPMSADLERGIVYIPTNPPTIDYYGGFRPGDNLFGTSIIALDAKTGERVWHFQTVHNDQWNYDLPNVPIIANLTVDGQEVPAVIQNTKQGMIFAFNRVTGKPIWPIEEREVLQTEVPGNWTSPTQPIPTRPAAVEPPGLPEEDVIDFTPALRAQALEIMKDYRIGGPYMPRMHTGNTSPYKGNIVCGGGVNITHPVSMDPETNIMYVSSARRCGGGLVQPGTESDDPNDEYTTGTTVVDWVRGPNVRISGPDGLPLFKPPYSRITAIDMNTGEHRFWIPIGEPNDRIKNHPALQGQDMSRWGGSGPAISMVTGSLLLTTEGRAGKPVLHAWNKATGESEGTVDLPTQGIYGMMTYLHDGDQYIVVQIGGEEYPSSLVALAFP